MTSERKLDELAADYVAGNLSASEAKEFNQLLAANPDPTREEIVEAISGNLCRCTGYQTIVDAIEHAAKLMKSESVEA